jgi:tRNA G18 (ribose-2'-O)-methylase SpoU
VIATFMVRYLTNLSDFGFWIADFGLRRPADVNTPNPGARASGRSPLRSPESPLVVVLDNVRSLYNVGAVMRACDGAGVGRLIACGITPYPSHGRHDSRRGPVAARADRELRKTALAAFDAVHVEYCPSAGEALEQLKREGATVVAVERVPRAESFWHAAALDAPHLALVFGHEVGGIADGVLALANDVVMVPMLGAGTSLNVAVAAGVVLYEVVRRRTRGPQG